MTDNQDSSDEIQSISQRLKTVTTIDSVGSSSPHGGGGGTRSSNIGNNATRSSQIQPFQEPKKSEKKTSDKDGIQCALESEDNEPVRNLPELNVPEKIIIIIDVTKERNCTNFKLGTGASYMPMFMIKRVVEIFVGAKSMLKRSHEFALMTLSRDSIKWICEFTSNVKTVLNSLDSLVEEAIDEDENFFDLSQVFEAIHARAPLHKNIADDEPPAFVTRAVLIYSRSNCIPRFQSGRKYFDVLSENPYFVLDSLFVHEPPSGDNKCEEVYTELTALDVKNYSYILEVGRNATKLHDNMAKLLAHPLQRPLQRNARYAISIPVEGGGAEEIQTNV